MSIYYAYRNISCLGYVVMSFCMTEAPGRQPGSHELNSHHLSKTESPHIRRLCTYSSQISRTHELIVQLLLYSLQQQIRNSRFPFLFVSPKKACKSDQVSYFLSAALTLPELQRAARGAQLGYNKISVIRQDGSYLKLLCQ